VSELFYFICFSLHYDIDTPLAEDGGPRSLLETLATRTPLHNK